MYSTGLVRPHRVLSIALGILAIPSLLACTTTPTIPKTVTDVSTTPTTILPTHSVIAGVIDTPTASPPTPRFTETSVTAAVTATSSQIPPILGPSVTAVQPMTTGSPTVDTAS